MSEEATIEQIETEDWVLNYWNVLFIKVWEYQAYCKNPISPSDWLAIAPEIDDKKFLRNLGRYKEKKNIFEIVYYFVIDLINKHSS